MSNDLSVIRKDVHRLGVLYEAMQDDTKKILEIVGSMLPSVQKIPKLESDMAEVKADIKTIKVAVTETNRHVHDHERRITRLEAKPV